jgi:hypothetical protein
MPRTFWRGVAVSVLISLAFWAAVAVVSWLVLR